MLADCFNIDILLPMHTLTQKHYKNEKSKNKFNMVYFILRIDDTDLNRHKTKQRTLKLAEDKLISAEQCF